MLLYHHIDFIGDVYVEKGIGTFAYFIPMKAAKVSESCVVSFQKGPGIPGLTGCNIGSPFYSLLCSNFYETRLLLRSTFQCFWYSAGLDQRFTKSREMIQDPYCHVWPCAGVIERKNCTTVGRSPCMKVSLVKLLQASSTSVWHRLLSTYQPV